MVKSRYLENGGPIFSKESWNPCKEYIKPSWGSNTSPTYSGETNAWKAREKKSKGYRFQANKPQNQTHTRQLVTFQGSEGVLQKEVLNRGVRKFRKRMEQKNNGVCCNGRNAIFTQSVHLMGKKSTQNDESNICIRFDPVTNCGSHLEDHPS